MIYLDNASTTYPKPSTVLSAMERYMRECGVSPGRGGYSAANDAERMVADVRRKLTQLVSGSDPAHMVFTGSCTDALNLALHGVLREGDHVITTMLEHNSVSRPLETLRARGMITLTRVAFNSDGFIDPADIAAAITPQTRLIAVSHASNVIGTIQPVAEVGKIAAEHGAYYLLDAAQTVGVVDIDVAAWHVDLLAFPAHKELLGPPGLGALYVGSNVEIAAYRQGGTGADSAHPVQPDEWPAHLEAGTPNTVGIAGLAAALAALNPAKALAHIRTMLARFEEGVSEVERVRNVCPAPIDARVGTCALIIDGMDAEDVGAVLDESFDIAARAGLHCAPYTHRVLGTFPAGALRISPGPFTTAQEIDAAVNAIREVAASA
ncbi:MAG: aminotransferase class V-fold PLP-dependent enzyme [Phycisphaerales bacterium]|nr:aminotransferase class V-fold PLP-dependent enzyme [Phycisphaerales bacterium]